MLPDNFDRETFIAELRERYARILLPKLPMAVEVEDGWLPLIDEMLGEIEACLEKYSCLDKARVVQIKEKFGGLRIYVRPVAEETPFPRQLQIELTDIRDEAERRSWQTCELCGDPGKLDDFGGYHQSLCRYHRHERLIWLAAGGPGSPADFMRDHAAEIEQAISEYMRSGELPAAWTARFDHLTGIRHRQAISVAKIAISQIAVERAQEARND